MTSPRALRHALALACSAVVAAASAQETVIDYRISERDTLIGLSETVFTGPQAWREIARLNRLPDANLIRPGQVLRVPARLMRSQALPVALASSVGEVRVAGAAAQAGMALAEGQQIETGANGSAVLALADGSRVRVPPSSLAEIVASRGPGATEAQAAKLAAEGWFAGSMRMLRGSVEVLAAKLKRSQPLEVTTPTAVVGVRGTQYRVALDGDSGATRSEVLEGKVKLESAQRSTGTDIPAGFGAAIDASAKKPEPVKLLPAPDLTAMPGRFERPLVRFALPAEKATVRVQVAQDEAFERIVSDIRVPAGTDVRIAGLDDARWHLRARRLDGQGIEGYDAARAFVLKARPEPPASNAPRSGGKQSLGPVEFQWSPNLEAKTARLQVARDERFKDIVVEREGVEGNRLTLELGAPGIYHWRLASTRADGDKGPFGDAQRFELRPLPEPPQGGLGEDGKSLVLAWGGRPEDKQHVELARDAAFRDIVAQADLDAPQWTLPRPSQGGTYYFRYRSTEPDGFVGPYSSPLVIEVPRDWRFLWLLAPFLLAL
ncbi:FecR domain-containing protein [Piscinibacter sp.]|uniref:FecR family protein n=1 Tax=Piscinibacter sp. TaxID=1903157 RepID=UPI0035B218E0